MVVTPARWPEGLSDGVSRKAKLLIEAPVNGGRNYNGPKVAKFPCRLNTDLHEWRNEMGAVSTMGPVKL